MENQNPAPVQTQSPIAKRENLILIAILVVLVGFIGYKIGGKSQTTSEAPAAVEEKGAPATAPVAATAKNGSPSATTPKPTTGTSTTTAPAVPTTLSLSAKATATGVSLNWSLPRGTSAPNGFILVQALQAKPLFPRDTYVQIPESATRTFNWDMTDGATHYFRICIWNGGVGGTSKCLAYSNDAKVVAPTKQAAPTTPTVVSSELILSVKESTNGLELRWTQRSGSTFQGYEILRSTTDTNPWYPKSGALTLVTSREQTTYYDTTAQAGIPYYYRICSLEGSAPATCGNVVKFVRQ